MIKAGYTSFTNPKRGYHLRNLGADVRIMWQWILKYGGRGPLDSYNPRSRSEERYYAHTTETWTEAIPVSNCSVVLSGNHT